ncbi:hypothetical protein L0Y65_04205 [Candidatus Micrarchaeota archaeon]|nr:hypothetical protein [Candidatus Micrarchaeota archaeon]
MTKYAFSDMAIEWLKTNSFSEDEIDALTDALNVMENSKRKGGPGIRLPHESSPRVSALMALLESITDAEGRPICFEESGLITIPDEAAHYFEEDLELAELERVTGKLKKVKFARRYSDPRRRGTMKGNEKFGSF